MSRAFVTESETDAAAEISPELPQSPHPNYVTPHGLHLLEERLADAQRRQADLAATPDDPVTQLALAAVGREIRYLEARLERAQLVDPAQHPDDEITFGAVVDVRDPEGGHRRVAIVGEDEADAEQGKVSWVSPLARALIGAGVGDIVLWQRPAGTIELEVETIRYPDREN